MSLDANSCAIGIDVGGTSIRAGVVTRDGTCLSACSAATPVDVSADELVHEIAAVTARACDSAACAPGPATPIGLAVPGTLDRQRRTIIRSVNVPRSEGEALGKMLEQRCPPRRVTMMNDALAATWGEFAALDESDRNITFVHLRLGTGIACGVIQNGSLLPLAEGRGTHWEILLVPDAPEGLVCLCGEPRCLEGFASGTALIKQSQSAGYADGLAGLQRAWEQGQKPAREIISGAIRGVRAVFKSISERFNAGVICVGGGVIKHLPALANAVLGGDSGAGDQEIMSKVVPARLGDDSGIVGAAMVVLHPDRYRV